MTTGEKLERALNFQMQLVDSMAGKFDTFESMISHAVVDVLIDVLKVVKTAELEDRVAKDNEARKKSR
jgi:hypothetical protein